MNATSNQTVGAAAPKNYTVKVAYKLFHHSDGGRFATCRAVVRRSGDKLSVRLASIKLDEEALLAATRGGVVHDWTLKNFRKEVSDAVRRLVSDPDGLRYPIRWNEDACLEFTFSEN